MFKNIHTVMNGNIIHANLGLLIQVRVSKLYGHVCLCWGQSVLLDPVRTSWKFDIRWKILCVFLLIHLQNSYDVHILVLKLVWSIISGTLKPVD